LCIERLQSRPGRIVLPGEKKDSRDQVEQGVEQRREMCHNHAIPHY
jgi:hypothetical protein